MASPPVFHLAQLLAALRPVLNPGVYVFARLAPGAPPAALEPLATFREAEGLTVVAEEAAALQAGLNVLFRAAWITLQVHSDLQAVGLTAAVAGALAEAGIACNVLAATCHDHLFVPVEQAAQALQCLRALQQRAMAPTGAG